MPSVNAPSLDAHQLLSRVAPASRTNESRLQRTFSTAVTDHPVSDEQERPEAVAQISAPASASDFSTSEDKQQSESQARTSSREFLLHEATVIARGTALSKIDGTKLAQIGGAGPSAVMANISGGLSRCFTTMVSNSDPSSPNVIAEQTPASSIVENGHETTPMSYDEALAFLNCASDWVDEDILWLFTNKTRIYPTTVHFARQAVKVIADKCQSKALLNWLENGVLEDPDQVGDKAERLPLISHPFAWRILDGELEYPPGSIGQEREKNTYLCSKPMSIVVGTLGVTYYVHRNVLAISPILERMCETEKAKETDRITLPDDEPSIFEHLLGYLYFQRFNPPVLTLDWDRGWESGWDEPTQTRLNNMTVNDEIMKTYVMAAKYGVSGLHAPLLESLEVGSSIEELYRSAKTVYEAGADDLEFREFFKKEVMAKVEKALEDCPYEERPFDSILCKLASWASSGGHLSEDLTLALANKVHLRHVLTQEDEVDETCEACGATACKCGWRECEDNKSAPSYCNDLYNTPGYCDNVESFSNKGQANEDIKEPQQESKVNDVSKEIRELTNQVGHIVAQLGNNQGSKWADGVGEIKHMPLWQATAAQPHFGQQIGGGSIIQGLPNDQPRNSWGSPLPASLSRQLYPSMHDQSAFRGRSAIAVQASSPWDCSITFPVGAVITNIRPVLGEHGNSCLVGWYGGLHGAFPARYVRVLP